MPGLPAVTAGVPLGGRLSPRRVVPIGDGRPQEPDPTAISCPCRPMKGTDPVGYPSDSSSSSTQGYCTGAFPWTSTIRA